jgi:uncharacterized repeat protein (TIGR02543 family)
MSRHRFCTFFLLIALLFTNLSGLGGAIPPVQAQSAGWTAYNDCSGTTGGNTTTYTVTSGSTTGLLRDYATGEDTAVTVTFTSSGSPSTTTTSGAETDSGTDAYNTFHGLANMAGVIRYGDSGYWVDITFTGLDPLRTYTFATSANRGSSSVSSRISRFTLSGDDGATNASTSEVGVNDDHSVYFSTGYNTVNGYVARWTGIQPGSDGTFVVRVQEQTAGNQGYGPSVFMLQEESTDPTITTSGSLNTFGSEPGTPSAEQSYTVSGNHLTDDIVITAPADFEISTTSGSGFTSSLTLAESGGTVAATPIYVRFNRATEGTSSGNIVHTSAGATEVDMAVSGSAQAPLEGWTAYNDCVTTSGQHIGDNVTTIALDGSGTLIDQATGRSTGVTAELTQSGGVSEETTYGDDTAENTDAYNTFFAFTDIAGNMHYGDSGWYVLLTFTGLDPAKTYTFATTANRNNSSYTSRISKFTLSDVDAATNASTSGVTVNDNLSVSFVTGYNTEDGFVARWTGIQPGPDGDFTVRVEADGSEYRAYGFSVFMLQEETTDPTITTAGTLNAFGSEPGTPSAEQSYTVSGSHLTDDIEITAPADFEISTTSGSGFSSSVTLSQVDGMVTATPIYVRFNRATKGTSSGNIVHTSTGATTRNVAVSGTATAGWVAYNDCGYIDGQISTNITTYECYTNDASGVLRRYADGTNTGVNVLVTTSGTVDSQLSSSYYGAEPNSGTDAYTTFHGFADMVGGVRLGSSSSSVVLTFTGLDPDHAYSFATSANRADSGYINRTTRFILSDVETATLASTSGVTVNNNLSVSFCTGYNTENGYVARWTGIQPGPDGDFVVSFEVDGGTYAYGPSVFLVQDETGGPPNQAPSAPTLVQPTNGTTGVSTSPILEVIVADPNITDTLDVTFYGRAAGGGAGEDFTLVALPDTQNEAQYYPAVFTSQTQWISDSRTAQNIVFATHLGDIVNTATDSTQYSNADASMDILDAGNVAYSVGPGNHDMGTGSLYETYFGVSRFSGKSWYGGHYGSDNYNNYSLFGASGLDFILINLQYGPTTAMLDWADALLKSNSGRQGIVASHSCLNVNDSWTTEGQTIYNALQDNPNLFLILCGHMHSSSDGAAQRTETGSNGNTIYVLQSDYQDYPNGGNGYLRVMRFSPANNKIYVQTYSPYVPGYLDDTQNQFELDYNMGGSTTAFQVIGTANGLASGDHASITWPGLDPSTEYEWYAAVSDGVATTTGSTWSFTTGSSAPTCYALTLGHTGQGSSPTASPANSTGCPAGQYVAGQSISLSGAVPDTGWQIANWAGTADDASTASTNALTMPASAHTAGVTYAQIEYTLTVNTVGSGSVTSNPAQASYHHGDVVTLTATADSGWSFDGWSGDLTGIESPKAITMDGDKSVTATFTEVVSLAGLTGTVTLQRQDPAPHASWSVPLRIELYVLGQGTPLYSFTPTTDDSGQFTLTDIVPDTYRIAVKHSHTLRVVHTVTLTAGSNGHAFGTLLEGDANDDNHVSLSDFSALSTAFNTRQGDAGYNDAADFNNDGGIDLLDFSLLSTNYNQAGEQP